MKLYSRNQLINVTVISSVVAVLIAVGITIGVYSSKNKKAKDEQSSIVEIVEDEESKEIDTSAFQQNVSNVKEPDSGLYTSEEIHNIHVYDMCNEGVVNINTRVTAYNWFLQPYVQDGGSGSGAIIDKRGYILTNVHVIQGASEIYVSLFDGNQYEAKVIGQDYDSDLAVIKFDPPKGVQLRTIGFGDSKKLKVGQRVIAIGNPFGLERTMTTGIVSGLGRPIQNSNNRIIRDMIQTDAAINPGNSGGPLLDTSGKIIGINTMIKSSSGSSSGVGFAVPSDTAVRVAADLMKYGKVLRGTIDASVIQLNGRIAQYAGFDITNGVMVSEVARGGKAEEAGLLGGTQGAYYGTRRDLIYIGGDVIIGIDDIPVTSLADYYSALESKRPGDTINVIVRRNKKNVTLKVTLVES